MSFIEFSDRIGYLEHLARYRFALSFVRDKVVLDLGCGGRDGPYLLGSVAERVVGVDIDPVAISYATEKYNRENVEYIVMDATKLEFPEDFFDVIVSFEVIEHISEVERYLGEVCRVLKISGLFIISTPNKRICHIEGTAENPSHVREFEYYEFKHLLQNYFKHIVIYGQTRGRAIVGWARFVHFLVRRIDLFGIRRIFSQRTRSAVSNWIAERTGKKEIEELTAEDFPISRRRVRMARNFIAVCMGKKRNVYQDKS
jgi:ubiquinone/menaquinone biosynthesis C-methylase UbiE